jgi:putative tryptophan/tyrosine transport system substrate-binding protein
MRRREFIGLLGGTALWPLDLQAQQTERMRRIGVLLNRAADDPEGQARLAAFQQGLQQLGWSDGGNMRIDTRWGADDVDLYRKYAAELVALAPNVILAVGTLSVTALQRVSRSLPIVFASIVDPVGAGVVNGLAQPGGNATGFMIYEYSLAGKWLELLKQIAPNVIRVAVLRDPTNPSGIAMFGAVRASASSLGIEVSPVSVLDAGEIERAIATFARAPNSGLIVTASASVSTHRDLILALAARYKMPAIYYRRYLVDKGGLMSYGHDDLQQFSEAANYVDRILKGEKPGDLPVQAPTKYELVINLKTAKALGLTIPPSVLARADEVIE